MVNNKNKTQTNEEYSSPFFKDGYESTNLYQKGSQKVKRQVSNWQGGPSNISEEEASKMVNMSGVSVSRKKYVSPKEQRTANAKKATTSDNPNYEIRKGISNRSFTEKEVEESTYAKEKAKTASDKVLEEKKNPSSQKRATAAASTSNYEVKKGLSTRQFTEEEIENSEPVQRRYKEASAEIRTERKKAAGKETKDGKFVFDKYGEAGSQDFNKKVRNDPEAQRIVDTDEAYREYIKKKMKK